MATLEDWNAYLNVLHELALIEDDLRAVFDESILAWYNPRRQGREGLAGDLLWTRFGVRF